MLIATVVNPDWPMNVEYHYIRWNGTEYRRRIRSFQGGNCIIVDTPASDDDVALAFAIGIGTQRPLRLVMA